MQILFGALAAIPLAVILYPLTRYADKVHDAAYHGKRGII